MLWAYFNLSQFLIIWSGNLPEEIPWYIARTRGGWQWLAIAIVLFHFVLPFVLLLSHRLKRRARSIAVVALVLGVMRFIDVFWLVSPAWDPGMLTVHLLDLAAVLMVGGVWIWLFVRQLEGRPLLPLRDPVYPVLQ
jgi:ABC-type phosphate transport system permease subunit